MLLLQQPCGVDLFWRLVLTRAINSSVIVSHSFWQLINLLENSIPKGLWSVRLTRLLLVS